MKRTDMKLVGLVAAGVLLAGALMATFKGTPIDRAAEGFGA